MASKIERPIINFEQNYEILKNGTRLREVFSEKPTVAFKRKRNLRNILCRNDVGESKEDKQGKNCKAANNVNSARL